jgi:hypothetical protein
VEHFLLHCPNFTDLRENLFTKLNYTGPLTIDILLHGNNEKSRANNLELFRTVHNFIKKSKRFQVMQL